MRNTATYLARLCLLCSCFFLIPFLSLAQRRGTVTVIKSPLIDTFVARRPLLNKSIFGSETLLKGYRVQIFFGSSRQSAYEAESKFLNEYPEIPAYVSYTEPNFKVQVGDFRTHLEAEKMENELKETFNTLFIIPTTINPPKQTDTSND